MLIAILSDTHDRVDPMARAIEMLRQEKAEYFIHCGDVGSPRVLDYLAGLPAAFVWGNSDWDRTGLARYANDIGVTCFGALGELELDGKKIAVLHGDDFRKKREILDQQQHDYLLQGHTHIAADQRIGRVRLINPGALHRVAKKTVALLDTRTDKLRLLQIDV